MKPTPATDIHFYPPDQYPKKHQIRVGTLDLLRDETHPTCLWHNGHLTHDWVELCGDAPDVTCGLLLKEGAIIPGSGRYIGVNRDPDIIRRNSQAYAGDTTQWVHADILHLLSDLDNPTLHNVGVLVFGAFYSPSNLEQDAILTPVLTFARSQYERLGQFLLVINQAMRGTRSVSLAAARTRFAQSIQEYCGIDHIPDSAFITYRSRNANMRILRLSFGW